MTSSVSELIFILQVAVDPANRFFHAALDGVPEIELLCVRVDRTAAGGGVVNGVVQNRLEETGDIRKAELVSLDGVALGFIEAEIHLRLDVENVAVAGEGVAIVGRLE